MKKRKYKSVITRRIAKSFQKIGICVLIVAFFAPMMAMRGTNSGFTDEEKSEGNTLIATSLDATANETSFSYTTGEESMEPGDEITQKAEVENVGNLDFQYKVQYANVTGGDLCDEIILSAQLNGTKVYDNKLKDFDTSPIFSPALNLDVTKKDNWEFKYSLPGDADGSAENKTCEFNYKFTAWQTDFSDKTSGFWDEEMLDPDTSIKIESGEWASAGDVVINEIMWMGSLFSSADEWIELRNMTDKDINIKNWNIYGAVSGSAGHLEIAGNTDDNYIIPARGFYLISNYKADKSGINDKIKADLVKTSLNFDDNYKDNGQIVLEDKAGRIIDEAPVPADKKWPAGIHGIFINGGLFHMSMQRKDIPGKGTSDSDWQTCVNPNCRSHDYWDGFNLFNYGTPKASNLSPVVINEFVPNPTGDDGAGKPNGEWAELYNISDENLDVGGWYFKNSSGDKIIISDGNTGGGNTTVPKWGRLVVYFEEALLDNNEDTLNLFSDMGTPDDDSDDVREDAPGYKNAGILPENKSFARFPDGVGIWIDPEATPGEENELDKKEKTGFQLLSYDKCFDGEELKKNNEEEICAPMFLEYIDMIKELDDEKIKDSTLLDILEIKKEKEEEKLAEMLAETEKLIAGQEALLDNEDITAMPNPDTGETPGDTEETDIEDVENDETVLPTENEEAEGGEMDDPTIKE